MWVAESGRAYFHCLLDTNVVSEILKRPQIVGKGFLRCYGPGNCIPCFTIATLGELHRKKTVYEEFIRFFSQYPCFVLKPMEQLLSDEVAAYPDPPGTEPVLFAAKVAHAHPQENLGYMLNQVFASAIVRNYMKGWKKDHAETLDSMLSLKENFTASRDCANAEDARRFVEEAGFQQLALNHWQWTKKQVDGGVVPSIDSFPSLKMSLFTTYYRLYDNSRKPERQDVVDILNSAPIPYIDGVITEKFQADILRKVRCREEFLEHLEISTLSDLRKGAEE